MSDVGELRRLGGGRAVNTVWQAMKGSNLAPKKMVICYSTFLVMGFGL